MLLNGSRFEVKIVFTILFYVIYEFVIIGHIMKLFFDFKENFSKYNKSEKPNSIKFLFTNFRHHGHSQSE